MISPEEAKLMHKKIKNSELKILSPKIGHMIQFEASEECNKVVDEFLKKTPITDFSLITAYYDSASSAFIRLKGVCGVKFGLFFDH